MAVYYCQTCSTTTPHWSRTSRLASWSCTTPSTTQPTLLAQTRHWSSWLKLAKRASSARSLSRPRTWHSTSVGHTNHSIFWNNLSPEGGDKPGGRVGSSHRRLLRFLRRFPRPLHRFGHEPAGLRLGSSGLSTDRAASWLSCRLFDQQGNIPVATTPLLMLDMWEHAFYLDYVNVKADYVKAFWNIVNWADVQARFEAAARVQHR